MSRKQKLLLYGTTIPVGIACAIFFPHNYIILLGCSFGLGVGVACLWSYRRSRLLWLLAVLLFVAQTAVIEVVKLPMLDNLSRSTGKLVMFAVMAAWGLIAWGLLYAGLRMAGVKPMAEDKEA